MRVYRTKRVRREWTDADRKLAKHLHEANVANAEIALALGRKPGAVRAWLHHNCRVWREARPVEYPKIIVAHQDVPAWYAAGWRFSHVGDGGLVFEWRESGIVRTPGQYLVTSKPATNHLELAA